MFSKHFTRRAFLGAVSLAAAASAVRAQTAEITGSITSIAPKLAVAGKLATKTEFLADRQEAAMVTARNVRDQLYQSSVDKIPSLSRIGDCFGPGTIAAAVHSGRKLAEEFGAPPPDFFGLPYRREVIELS